MFPGSGVPGSGVGVGVPSSGVRSSGVQKIINKENMADSVVAPKTHLGIPIAQFVENVAEFMKLGSLGKDAAEALKTLDDLYTKYKFMEQGLQHKKIKYVP